MSIRNELRTYRAVNGLTQSAIAKSIGVPPAYISQWERGKWRPGKKWQALIFDAIRDNKHPLSAPKSKVPRLDSEARAGAQTQNSAFALNGSANSVLKTALRLALEHGKFPDELRAYLDAALKLA